MVQQGRPEVAAIASELRVLGVIGTVEPVQHDGVGSDAAESVALQQNGNRHPGIRRHDHACEGVEFLFADLRSKFFLARFRFP